jgi:hypothetical protein
MAERGFSPEESEPDATRPVVRFEAAGLRRDCSRSAHPANAPPNRQAECASEVAGVHTGQCRRSRLTVIGGRCS